MKRLPLAEVFLFQPPLLAVDKPFINSRLLNLERAMMVGEARATFECEAR